MAARNRRLLLLGAHFSIAKGLHQAILEADAYRCTALQIFTKNASTWKEKLLTEEQIRAFKAAKDQTGITEIMSHTSYLINIGGPDPEKLTMSREALKQELIRCGQLEIPYVVLHPGAHMGGGEEIGIKRIAENINRVFAETKGIKPRLLLETTAGQGSSIGHRFEQIAAIIEKVQDPTRIGVCLDTCHIFAAGYDISTKSGYDKTIQAVDDILRLNNLFVIHLNDAKKPCGSRVDRHEHIGDGTIGANGFRLIMSDTRLRNIPKVIETPKLKAGMDADVINLELLQKFIR